MYEELKQKDIDVLAYLKDHSSRYGYPPSVRAATIFPFDGFLFDGSIII